ncbi:MAG: hypothetical protein M0Q27_01415 [Candidatus Colwellbacteria bacterium]|nr:hypothetical protein [Candidatus Colwellbacteria bacterium]
MQALKTARDMIIDIKIFITLLKGKKTIKTVPINAETRKIKLSISRPGLNLSKRAAVRIKPDFAHGFFKKEAITNTLTRVMLPVLISNDRDIFNVF